MLVGKNVVIVKAENKSTPPIVREYDRVYLEFASNDPTEDYNKTSEGKTLQVDGKDWKGIRPKNSVTSVKAEDLIPEAVNYFQTTYPAAVPKEVEAAGAEAVSDYQTNRAWLTMLEAASYGADLWQRNKIQADIRPGKPVDKATAINKMVKMLKALRPNLSDAKALALATTMVEAEDEPATENAI